MILRYSHKANLQIEEIFSNDGIYDRFGNFTQQFLMWNSEFHRFVNKNAINKQRLSSKGIYKIGNIGVIAYNYFNLIDTDIFEILEFRFSKLPYQQKRQQYKVIGDAGYRYKIIQSTFNHKYSILTPQRKYLTKFVFDAIIGFHHSSNDFNTIYAIGFQGNRVFAIYQDGDIKVLPYSKEEYLKMRHRYCESYKSRRMLINEFHLKSIVRNVLRRYLQS